MSTTYNPSSVATGTDVSVQAMQHVSPFLEEAYEQGITGQANDLIGLLACVSKMTPERVLSTIQTTTAQARKEGFDKPWSALIGFCSSLGYQPEELLEAARTVQQVSSTIWQGTETSTGNTRSFTTT